MKMKKINQKRLKMKIENEISKRKLKFKIENQISFSFSNNIISLLNENCQEKLFFQEKETKCAAARDCH